MTWHFVSHLLPGGGPSTSVLAKSQAEYSPPNHLRSSPSRMLYTVDTISLPPTISHLSRLLSSRTALLATCAPSPSRRLGLQAASITHSSFQSRLLPRLATANHHHGTTRGLQHRGFSPLVEQGALLTIEATTPRFYILRDRGLFLAHCFSQQPFQA